MDGELYAFTDALDTSLTISTNLSRVFSKKIALHMVTGSKQVFNVITSGKILTEKD